MPRSPRLRRRLVALALCAGGLLAAGCGTAAAPGTAGTTNRLVVHKASHAATTTTSTTLPPCGSTRDPLDPTHSPPPAGSPAICPP
jgi:hypothetical protein